MKESYSIAELCEKPVRIKPKYHPDGKFFKHRVQKEDFLLVPCGKCKVCKYKFAREWGNRIMLEMKYYGGAQNCAFVTLTYNDENLPEDKSVHKKEIQDYLKRVRERLNGREIKYYAVGEYGSKEQRAHYHLVIMNVDGFDRFQQLSRIKQKMPVLRTGDDWYHMHMAWKNKGYTDIQRVRDEGSAGNYVASYLNKMDKAEKDAKRLGLKPPFKIMSKGLGRREIIKIAEVFAKNPKTMWPVYYLSKVGYDKKKKKYSMFKVSIGRYLRRILHQVAGKMKELLQSNLEFRKAAYNKYCYNGNMMADSNMFFNEKLKEARFNALTKVKWRLQEI